MTKTRSQGNGDNPPSDGNSVNVPNDGVTPPVTNLSVVVVDGKMSVQERVNAFLGNFSIENRDAGKVLIFRTHNCVRGRFPNEENCGFYYTNFVDTYPALANCSTAFFGRCNLRLYECFSKQEGGDSVVSEIKG